MEYLLKKLLYFSYGSSCWLMKLHIPSPGILLATSQDGYVHKFNYTDTQKVSILGFFKDQYLIREIIQNRTEHIFY